MLRETAQLWLRDGADISAVKAALAQRLAEHAEVTGWNLGLNLEGSVGTGDASLDCVGEHSQKMLPALLEDLPEIERFEAVAYTPIATGCTEPELSNGIRRNLWLRVRPEASPEQVAGLEHDLAQMPAYMATMRNWTLARVDGPGPWTHVWIQEFARIEDLMGEYLLHPHHWGWVDHWFDPDFPDWTVDTQLCHAFCPLENSLITLESEHAA